MICSSTAAVSLTVVRFSLGTSHRALCRSSMLRDRAEGSRLKDSYGSGGAHRAFCAALPRVTSKSRAAKVPGTQKSLHSEICTGMLAKAAVCCSVLKSVRHASQASPPRAVPMTESPSSCSDIGEPSALPAAYRDTSTEGKLRLENL